MSLFKNGLINEPLYASDVSAKAIKNVNINARNNSCNIIAKKSNLFSEWKNQKFEMIVSDISSISDKTNNFETIMYTLIAGVLAVVVVAFISISRTGNIDIKKLRKFVKP